MSAPRFHITFEVPGSGLKFHIRTAVVLGEDPVVIAKELGEWIAIKVLPGFQRHLESVDLPARRRQWGEYYAKLLEGWRMG